MAKIVLIDPRGWQGAVGSYRASPNIGIAYLIPHLQKSGHEVLLIDLNNEDMTDEQVLRAVEQYHVEFVGFSVKTATVKSAKTLASKIKGIRPDITVIFGGPHTTIAWKKLILDECVDYVVVGEGEYVFPDLIRHLKAKDSVDKISGVITANSLKEGFVLDRSFIPSDDLDILEYPDYDLFPHNVKDILRHGYPLVTSRGCVYNCIYCSVPRICGRKFRKRSSESVIKELVHAKEKYGANKFEIIDDVFNLDINRCKEICLSLIEADLGMQWSCPNGLRADRIDSYMAELMAKSGCTSVMVGIESADENVLANVKKGETIEDIQRGINIFQKAGIKVGGYFIIGLPGDSFNSLKRSVNFAKKKGISAHFNMLVPYPGTALWDWATANSRNFLDIEDSLHFADDRNKVNSVIDTTDFTAADRQKAYEMVHVMLGRFDMVIPSDLNRWKYHWWILGMLWRYKKVGLPRYVIRLTFNMFKGKIGTLIFGKEKESSEKYNYHNKSA